MIGLPRKLGFLARMPPHVSAAYPLSPPATLLPPFTPSPPGPPSPPIYGGLVCSQGYSVVLEPYRFSPDSYGWYGGVGELDDPVSTQEEYVGSETVGSQLGVEFPLPLNLSEEEFDSGLLIIAESLNDTIGSLGFTLEYFDLADNNWHQFYTLLPISLSSFYEVFYYDTSLYLLPTLSSITKIRVLVTVLALDVGGEVRFNHLTIPYCSVALVVLPSPPSPPLTEPIQPPDIPGTLPPFIEVEAPLPPLPPPPPIFLPPLPPGSEILRPNRDILVRLWKPRPAFMQLNDPLNPGNPIDAAVPLYGPATVDTFDETTGNYTGTIRPRVEVGFTTPITEGPWDALQLRFRATRSRPPQPELVAPPLPIPATKETVIYPCPSDQILTPRATDFPGVWQIPPLEKELTDSVDKPTHVCCITAPVNIPPGAPGQIALTPSPIQWDAGYNQVKVRLIARAKAAQINVTDTHITGFSAIYALFEPTPTEISTGFPPYQVRWSPFGCNDQIQAYRFSSTEIRGAGILQTNMDIHAEFFLSSQESDNLTVQVSTDGINYYGAVVFDLAAFQSTVIYYRIALNNGGLSTPTGKLVIGVGLIITGPFVVTGINIITYSNGSAPFMISVAQSVTINPPFLPPCGDSPTQLMSQCRVGVSLQGNMELMQSLVQYTDTLTSEWPSSNGPLFPYVLTWNGFWSAENIRDLRIRLSPEALVLEEDVPFIEISAMDVKIHPYCPGVSQPLSQPLIKLNQVDIVPIADVSVTGWAPVPAWSMLVNDPTLASDNDVLADPRTDNQLLVEMAEPTGLPDVMPGYARKWIEVEAIIQARIITWSSLSANLLVSTTFGQEQWTPPLTTNQEIYFVTWNYNPGLTTDQINRLKIALIANSLSGNGEVQDPVEVAVCALTARMTFQDVLVTPTATMVGDTIITVVESIITVVESSPEIFSCGSLGDCGAPQGRIVARVTVTNPDAVPATVNFIMSGRANIRVSDSSDNSYNLSQAISGSGSGHDSITFFIYGWIGDTDDPFPVDPTDGGIIISLVYSGGVYQVAVPWYYIGL